MVFSSFFPISLAHQMDYFDDNYSNLQSQILNMFINYSNTTYNNSLQVPETLQFNTNSLIVVIVYCIFFLFSAFGNLTVFCSLRNLRRSHSRINLMILHLAIADLFVTFIMIPLEIGWRITVQWIAGNVACKIFLVFRAFGLYLSSNVIVCISLDRYFAILYPLKVANAKRRGKVMLFVAWVASFIWAFPQGIVFHVSTHPNYPNFTQCVSFGFFENNQQEVAYNLFCVSVMYFVPLAVIIFVYTAIMWKIFHKSQYSNKSKGNSNAKMQLRRSQITNVEKARSRTLRLAVTIVLVFLWCWTPYVVMTLWYMIDRKSAENVPNWLQDTLFMMAVSNSCVNPIVYGSYAMGLRQKCIKIIQFFGCAKNQTSLRMYRYDVERIRTSEYI